MELSQEAQQGDISQPADHSLRDAIAELIDLPDDRAKAQADDVMQLLVDSGHLVPGAPPAAVILQDAKSFAERLTLSNLALRILNMLAFSNVQTPETTPARKWIDDYLEGRNHGPVGHPMLWPGGLPGMAQLLRDWGFAPTVALPGRPSFVARAMQQVTKQ